MWVDADTARRHIVTGHRIDFTGETSDPMDFDTHRRWASVFEVNQIGTLTRRAAFAAALDAADVLTEARRRLGYFEHLGATDTREDAP